METRKRKSKLEDSDTIDKRNKSSKILEKIFSDIEDKAVDQVSKPTINKKKSVDKNEKSQINLENTHKEVGKNIDGTSNWKKIESVIFKNYGSIPSEKILGLDLDDTLIVRISGAKFAKDKYDWRFFINVETIKKAISKYHNEGYRIVIFSNQKGISKGTTDENEWKQKIDDIAVKLGIPLLVMAAVESDYYRKPSIGMWKLLENEVDEKKNKLDPKSFLFVGDAAGRLKNYEGKKDFSDSDHKFAINIGGKFETPEQFFLGQNSTVPKKFSFNPQDYKSEKHDEKDFNINDKQQEMVIFVGSPGSGKTSFYSSYFSNYIHINNDTLKSAVKCLKGSEETLASGKSVVIDNTNPTKAVRSSYISLDEKYKIPVRCFYFKYTKGLVFHLNNLRDINIGRKHHSKSVPDVVIHTWFKNLEEPSLAEGFKEIKVIPFVPGPFENPLDEEIFYMHSAN